MPLRASEQAVTARLLGEVTSLARPTRQDVEFAPKTRDWWWQPVGMDISSDQRAAVILTYRAVYYFERAEGQSWIEALNSMPLVVGLGGFENAEAVAFSDDGRTVAVTGENKNSALMFVELEGASIP